MAKRYRCELLASVTELGVTSLIVTGNAVEIAGVKYVRVGASLVEDGSHWHDTREAAQAAKADNVAAIGQTILAQAERFRAQEAR